MTDTAKAWKVVRGDEIGGDHIWWFHRTFREVSPGGHGRARFGGHRTRLREAKGAAVGERNGKTLDDSAAYVLAWCLLGLCEATTAGEAAFQAVMLREWPEAKPTRQTLKTITADARFWHRHDAIEGEVRRLRDKLYAERRLDEGLFAARIAWLRNAPGHQVELAQYRNALVLRISLPSRP